MLGGMICRFSGPQVPNKYRRRKNVFFSFRFNDTRHFSAVNSTASWNIEIYRFLPFTTVQLMLPTYKILARRRYQI